jgi:hypothetical protein
MILLELQDVLILHLSLVASTKVEESDEIYFTKVGLSMGRSKFSIPIYSDLI